MIVYGLLHRRRECHRAVLAGSLGLIEGDVRVSEQLSGDRPVPFGDADTGGHLERHVARRDGERGPQDLDDSLCHHLCTRSQRGSLDQHHELVASQSANGLALAQGAGHSGRHSGQQLIAGLVAERVVDILEVVKIEEQRCDVGVLPAGAGKHLLGSVEDQGAVGESGEGVM